MGERTIAIMQPTYLPWIGYFDLIDRVDCFVFLDSVQFSKQSWQQRNRLKGPQGAVWQSVPVLSKGRFGQSILEVELDPTKNFPEKQLKTIAQLYGSATFFDQYIDELTGIILKRHRCLVDLNIELIGWLCRSMGIETESVRSSSLEVAGRKTELLVDICKALGADRYLSVEGSRGYIEENNLFSRNGIELVYQEFCHPVYRQLHGEFVSQLSVVDLLFNEGSGSLAVIRQGRHGRSRADRGEGPGGGPVRS